NAVERHGIAAVDRHHHDVEPADRREMAFVELVMQMPEMTDAEPADLEDEDRVAILDHFSVRIVAEKAADVGRHIADVDIAGVARSGAVAMARHSLRWASWAAAGATSQLSTAKAVERNRNMAALVSVVPPLYRAILRRQSIV